MSCSGKHTYVKDTGAVFGYTASNVKNVTETVKTPIPTTVLPTGQKNFIPSATAFRMTGDYSDNVAITIGPDGNLTYFPAPSDITADSKPVNLGDGWWLNRQGLSSGSVFTKYTFAEYAALDRVPTPEQLKNAVIPGAFVTQMVQLPFKTGEASQNIEAIKEYLKNYE